MAFGFGRQYENALSYWEADEQETRDVVNNCDVAGARKILKRNKGTLLGLARGPYGYRDIHVMRNFETLAFTGLKTWIDFSSVEEEWHVSSLPTEKKYALMKRPYASQFSSASTVMKKSLGKAKILSLFA
jgi:hypothetical protein